MMALMDVDFHWIMLFMVSGIFGLCLLIFTAMHTGLLLSNRTTIESMEGARSIRIDENTVRTCRDTNIYDLGAKKNFVQVMGTNPVLWFVPVYTR
ncbi:hypothetical protein HK102_007262 [Quaeritorhiza haematococci]|nr:hypothetical protein HK102_007262 [Quaeritorhiza haematococci]